jgi:hypothetical protein
MRLGLSLIAAAGLLLANAADAQSVPPPPDYASASAWLCRADSETLCTSGLDAVGVANDGTRTPLPFVAATDPKIDCFYVYPTVSAEPTPLADMIPGDAERRAVAAQAARLSSRCRVFAPVYRQVTLAGLRATLAQEGGRIDFDAPYRDVRAAWAWYLAHDNQGRGVVLIGHSQGTIILQRLIAEEIDGKPVAERLVAAFLAGDPVLPVPAGKRVGGVFKHIPLCASAAQTGCAYVWSSYLDSDATPKRTFANDPGNGLVAGCVTPAAPGGGAGELKAVLPRPAMAPVSDPPWVALRGQLTGACTADDRGNVLRVHVIPGPFADVLAASLGRGGTPGWGLHRLDVNLVEGNILDVIDAELAGWR